MTAEREGLADIAGVLAEHQIVRDDFSPHCSCGLFRDKRDHDQANYRAHLADALADLLAGRDWRVRAEAIEAVAREWQYGGWTILTSPPPAGSIKALALGQRVMDWLRERVDQTEGDHRPNGCCDYHRHIADGCCHCDQIEADS